MILCVSARRKKSTFFTRKPVPTGRLPEGRLYAELESELPFDLLVYTEEEWRLLLGTELSFARHIRDTGRVLYAAD